MSQAEDENAASEGQSVTDSEAITTLKLQLELEKIKAMRSETDGIIDAKRKGDVID